MGATKRIVAADKRCTVLNIEVSLPQRFLPFSLPTTQRKRGTHANDKFYSETPNVRFTMAPKIFCIGFHKTGTTSLSIALRTLGYRVTGPNGIKDPDIEKNVFTMAYRLVEKFDAFQDNPWPIIYKELDKDYPGSKFILTLRDSESWIKSQVRHFGRQETPMRRWIYGVGCPEGNEAIYLKRFEEHNEGVMKYFRERPQDLLVLDLAKGDGWEKLCSFLGADITESEFPHANKAIDREIESKDKGSLLGRLYSLLSKAT
ncbi:MAG: hypothetical protein K9J85_11380 [Desulfobacteraceae bacterium]|nr:hypothetical protein [Desulfobacteraceae bacterium]